MVAGWIIGAGGGIGSYGRNVNQTAQRGAQGAYTGSKAMAGGAQVLLPVMSSDVSKGHSLKGSKFPPCESYLSTSGKFIFHQWKKNFPPVEKEFSTSDQTFKASEIGREFGYHSLQKNFEVANKAETKETIIKAHTIADKTTKNKVQSDTGYQLVPPSRSYIPPTKANENLSIAQAVGNVASTALNAAEEMISGAGGLINPQTHGDDYAEMAWQHKLRNQAKKKKKRGRSI